MGSEASTQDVDLDVADIAERFKTLPLSNGRKATLDRRVVSRIDWADDRAKLYQRAHYALKGTTIFASLALPVVAGLALTAAVLRWVTFVVSLVVAGATTGLLLWNPTKRWLHYRGAVERYLDASWEYIDLRGDRYAGKTHAQGFDPFMQEFDRLRGEEGAAYADVALPQEPGSEQTSS
jgi:Protein of unknown function (DUF4231)